MTQQVDGNSETTQIYTFVHSKLFHAKGFTPVLRDIKKKKKQTAKTRKVIKTSTLLCYKYWKYVSKCDKKYYERLQMHKWSKCNTLSSEAPIKKDYYKALQNNFFIQKLWSSY